MTGIISLNADYRFHNARVLANSLNGHSAQVNAHIKIAQDDPQHDFFWAKSCAFNNDGTGFDLIIQRGLLHTIAAAEACFNLVTAKVTADSIDDPIIRELAYLDIINIEAETDIQAAKITAAATIKEPLRKDCATRYIAVKLAKSYPEAAKTMAALIRDDFHRQKALSEIEAQLTM